MIHITLTDYDPEHLSFDQGSPRVLLHGDDVTAIQTTLIRQHGPHIDLTYIVRGHTWTYAEPVGQVWSYANMLTLNYVLLIKPLEVLTPRDHQETAVRQGQGRTVHP